MMQWAMQYINPDLVSAVKTRLYGATMNAVFAPTGTPGTPGSPVQPGIPTSGTSGSSTGHAGPTPGYTGSPGIGSQAGSLGIEGVIAAGAVSVVAGATSAVTGAGPLLLRSTCRGVCRATGAVTGAGQGPGASGRVYEVSKAGGMPGTSSGLPVYAVAGVVILVALVGVGYLIAGRGKI